MLMASFKDTKVVLKGQVVEIKRGQLIRGTNTLAERWGWSRNKVIRTLKSMESDKMCTLTGTPYGTLITIENYERFQDMQTPNGTADGTSDGTSDGTRMNKVKEVKEIGAFEAPAAAAVFSFFEDHGYRSDPDAFLAYYEGTGWKKKNGQPITDWKSAAKAWERREKQFAIDRGAAEPASGKSNVPKPPEPPKYKEFEKEPERDTVPMPDEVRRKLLKAVT